MATNADTTPTVKEEPTIGRLVADTTADISTLVKQEIELAKTELAFSAKKGGIGAGMLVAAGVLLLFAVIFGSIALAFGFAAWLSLYLGWGFLIVFGIYALIAIVLALIGISNLKKIKAPEKTMAAVKSNKQVLKRG